MNNIHISSDKRDHTLFCNPAQHSSFSLEEMGPIGHFQVALCLSFKTSPRANHSNENEFDLHENGRAGETHFQIMVSHKDSF